MPFEDGETQPDYPRPPCVPSFIKLGLIRILHQYFTHSLYVNAGETTIMPPRVLASGPKHYRGNKAQPQPPFRTHLFVLTAPTGSVISMEFSTRFLTYSKHVYGKNSSLIEQHAVILGSL